MTRTIEAYGKNGVIGIKGNSQESILYLGDKPIQYSWLAEIGSTWRYHIAQGLNNQIVKLHDGIVEMLKRGLSNEGEFLASTDLFIQYFKYGTYEFGHYELFEDIDWIEIPENENYESFDYYGGGFDISPTQNSINDSLVDEYKELILRGARPTMVILHVENSSKFFILDGHHKFIAYGKAKINANSIVITKLGNDYKSIEETIKLAKQMNCSKKEYFDSMRTEKSNTRYYKGKNIKAKEIFKVIKY